MILLDPAAGATFLQRLTGLAGTIWAELFLERRTVVTLECAGEGPLRRREARDEGAGARIVGRDRSARHAAAGGWPWEAADCAVSRLVAGEEGPATGRAGERGAGRPVSTGTGAHLEQEVARLTEWMNGLRTAAVRRLPAGTALNLRAVVSGQEVAHVSSDSPLAGDGRGGVVVQIGLRRGSFSLPPRRIAAADVAGLAERHPAGTLLAALAEAAESAGSIGTAPDGETTVVLAPGAAGLFIHETVGHLSEAGEPAGDGFLPGARRLTVVERPGSLRGNGSYQRDDEGVSPREVVLLDSGRRAGVIAGRWSVPDGLPSTGHGRRQSWRDLPQARLATTIALPGVDAAEEIVMSTSRGVMVEEFGRGAIDPLSGEFVLHAVRGRAIEQGRVTRALREFLVIGEAREALSSIDRIGSDLAHDGGAHSCVRGGQAVPVIVGLPTLRMVKLKVRSLAIA